MESYTISNVFLQVLARYGLIAAGLAVSFFVCLAVLAYYLKVRIELMRQEQADAQQLRLQDNQTREAERQRLMGILDTQAKSIVLANADTQKLLSNHLAHDEASRERLAEVLTKTQGAMEHIADDLSTHREEEGRRAKEGHEDMEKVNNRLTGIEARSGLPPRAS